MSETAEQQSPPREAVTIYTDGSGSMKDNPGGWAFVLQREGAQKELIGHGGVKLTTSNRMELTAVLEGIKALGSVSSDIKLVSDSQYVCKGIEFWMHDWIRREWRTSTGKDVKNQDIWLEIYNRLTLHNLKQVAWVKGHAGHPENEFCDRLAGIERSKIIDAKTS